MIPMLQSEVPWSFGPIKACVESQVATSLYTVTFLRRALLDLDTCEATAGATAKTPEKI